MTEIRIEYKHLDTSQFESEQQNNKFAAFTHFVQNSESKFAKSYKKDAISYVKDSLVQKYGKRKVTNKEAELELLQFILNFKTNLPFPEPESPTFTFIDLFAGIGGFRLALQNLGGKCVYSSEWQNDSKITYRENFGEIPFGDITSELTKSYIPNEFDILCAGFPCQAFSIAGFQKVKILGYNML